MKVIQCCQCTVGRTCVLCVRLAVSPPEIVHLSLKIAWNIPHFYIGSLVLAQPAKSPNL